LVLGGRLSRSMSSPPISARAWLIGLADRPGSAGCCASPYCRLRRRPSFELGTAGKLIRPLVRGHRESRPAGIAAACASCCDRKVTQAVKIRKRLCKQC